MILVGDKVMVSLCVLRRGTSRPENASFMIIFSFDCFIVSSLCRMRIQEYVVSSRHTGAVGGGWGHV